MKKLCWNLVGGFSPTHLKNMLVKLGIISPIFGVKIKNVCLWSLEIISNHLTSQKILSLPVLAQVTSLHVLVVLSYLGEICPLLEIPISAPKKVGIYG